MLNLIFDPFPTLTTPRLSLRRVTLDDVDAMFLQRSNPDVMRFIPRPLAQTKDDVVKLINNVEDLLQRNEAINWGITRKPDNTLIGTFCFWNVQLENQRAEIGYMLHPLHQGVGIMQEVMTAALDYGFNTMKLHSVEAHVDPENVASIKLLERNGFVREAFLKENVYFNGKYLDTAVYCKLSTS